MKRSSFGITSSDVPLSERTTLGAEQEAWVRAEIMNSTAHFTLVGAGIQFLPYDRPQEFFYPGSLMAVLATTNPKTRRLGSSELVLISGDVHYGEILIDPCTEHLQGYRLKEYTSSGLSHSEAEWPYLGVIYYYYNMYMVPPRFNVVLSHQTDADRWMNRNYAMINFELGDSIEDSKLHFELKDVQGRTVLKDSLGRDYFL